MPLARYGAQLAMDRILGSADPASVFLALMFTAPTSLTVQGSGLNEPPSNKGYARVQVANSPTQWPPAVNGVKRNGEQIVLPVATEGWGTVRHFAVCTSATGGSVIGWGSIVSKNVRQGDQLAFKVNALAIRETPL